MVIVSKQNRAIIVAQSDEHGGHNLGLLNPETKLTNERGIAYSPIPTETQNMLWETREWGRKEIKHLAGNSPIVLFKLGDVNQGMVYDVDNRLSAQVEIALMNDMPWLKMKNVVKIRIAHGTGSHSFGYGDAEIILAGRMKDKRPDLDVQVMQHGYASVYDCTVDFAHHGPNTGSREWLKGNVALYYLKDIMMRDILRGRKPPNLVLRGHYHSLVEVFNRINGADGKVYRSWLYVLPSLTGANGFAVQVTKSEFEITNGIVAWEIIDGRVRESFEFIKTTDIRTKEELL